jgi:hypothetical protein
MAHHETLREIKDRTRSPSNPTRTRMKVSGGRAKHHRAAGGKVSAPKVAAGKDIGFMTGGAVRPRLDRPTRRKHRDDGGAVAGSREEIRQEADGIGACLRDAIAQCAGICGLHRAPNFRSNTGRGAVPSLRCRRP